MVSTFEEKRKQVLAGDLRMKRYDDESGALRKMFSDKSFAIIDNDLFVPLIPRHMTKDNWRELYWLRPKKLVINGKKHKSLCSVCRLSLSCLSKGQGRKSDFRCVASGETLIVKLTKRKKGEP